jgi:hypothetical protein
MLPAALKELLALVKGTMGDPVCSVQMLTQRVGDKRTRGNDASGDRFGVDIRKKGENILRIKFQNIGGFSINKTKHKEKIIRQGITKWEFDVFGCAETNID